MKCPVCKKKCVESYNPLDQQVGEDCPNGCYSFRDDNHDVNGGFYIRIGDKEMNDLYAYSVRKSRMQNLVTSRWVKNERKLLKQRRASGNGNGKRNSI